MTVIASLDAGRSLVEPEVWYDKAIRQFYKTMWAAHAPHEPSPAEKFAASTYKPVYRQDASGRWVIDQVRSDAAFEAAKRKCAHYAKVQEMKMRAAALNAKIEVMNALMTAPVTPAVSPKPEKRQNGALRWRVDDPMFARRAVLARRAAGDEA